MADNIEKQMRDVNRSLQVESVMREIKSRAHYLKPSQKRAMQKAKRMANIRKYGKSGDKKVSRTLQIFGSSLV